VAGVSVPFRAREACAWTGGELLAGDAEARFAAVSIDTRTCPKGALFTAIRGPRHDAHAYLARALEAGAAGLLLERARADAVPPGADAALIAVDDTTRALGALASGHRAGFDGPLVAITGSNGKTTTKEMCAAILARRGPCLRNRGNLNNQFGLPLTLLEREPEHRTVVVELGMNHRGEIATLAAISRPQVGVLTNVGTAHIEHLGSQDEIAREKGDLLAALPPDGVAVVNADDRRAADQAARHSGRVLRFGAAPAAEVRAEDVRQDDEGFGFRLATPAGAVDVRVAGLGETTLPNALAAAAAALAAGASLDDLRAGLADYAPPRGRMQHRRLGGGIELIDDTYNANPQSLEAALKSLARLKGPGRAVAVLGDMGELGRESGPAHRAAGGLAAELALDFLFALGDHAGEVAEGARSAGMAAERVHVAASHDDLGERLLALLAAGDWVLVKGSRSMRMERVVDALAGAPAAGDAA
jgi:UDP-N-acetylmuramoyl-tripeptide--D-alanyl-D-alanine ligase